MTSLIETEQTLHWVGRGRLAIRCNYCCRFCKYEEKCELVMHGHDMPVNVDEKSCQITLPIAC